MRLTLVFLTLIAAMFSARPAPAQAQDSSSPLSAYDIIQMVNDQRMGNGLPALQINGILMGTAQATAETMAASELMGHIGNVSGRIQSAGYGSGTVFATENWAKIKPGGEGSLMGMWADEAHQIPMVKPDLQDIGVGVALSPAGFYYYVLHAAYSTGGGSRPVPTSSGGGYATSAPGTTPTAKPVSKSEYIFGVVTVTPGADGKLVHTVMQGQAMWSIAIAYNTKKLEIAKLNNLSSTDAPLWIGQKIIIPTSSVIPPTATAPATLTPTATLAPATAAAAPAGAAPSAQPGQPSPTPAAETTGAIPASMLPSVLIGLVISLGGILALYGAFGKRR